MVSRVLTHVGKDGIRNAGNQEESKGNIGHVENLCRSTHVV